VHLHPHDEAVSLPFDVPTDKLDRPTNKASSHLSSCSGGGRSESAVCVAFFSISVARCAGEQQWKHGEFDAVHGCSAEGKCRAVSVLLTAGKSRDRVAGSLRAVSCSGARVMSSEAISDRSCLGIPHLGGHLRPVS
jgi:hypothetical protein